MNDLEFSFPLVTRINDLENKKNLLSLFLRYFLRCGDVFFYENCMSRMTLSILIINICYIRNRG